MPTIIRPAIYVTLLNGLFYLFFHVYYESYEGLLSTLVSGVYTVPCLKDWNNDLQFLMLPLYACLNQKFVNVQVYGITLFILNWLSLSFLGVLLYNTLLIIRKSNIVVLFFLCYSILSIDNFMNLSSNRIAFVLSTSIFWMIELYRYREKKINIVCGICSALLFIIACLVRFEVVLLCSLFYLVILVVYKKLHPVAVSCFLISLLFFTVYHILIATTATEAKKVAMYKEKQFFDREDINYGKLTALQSLDVTAFKDYQLMDQEHLKLSFYNSISKSNSHPKHAFYLLDGISLKSSLLLIIFSASECLKIWYYPLFLSLLTLFAIIKQRNKRYVWISAFFFLFPIALSAYVYVPLRFFVPYFSILCILNIVFYLHRNLLSYRQICCATFIMFIFVISGAAIQKKHNKILQQDYEQTSRLLKRLTDRTASGKYIAISNIMFSKFFPVQPFSGTKRLNILFINFYFFESYYCYQDTWTSISQCNPYSLFDKLNFIIDKKLYLIIDLNTASYLKKYIKLKYHKDIVFTKFANFDSQLDVFSLAYK
jgi:hypothetical protein